MYINQLRQQALLYGIFLLDELEDTDMCAVFFFLVVFFLAARLDKIKDQIMLTFACEMK